MAWNAANIHVHTIGEDNGFELNLILLFAVIGILLDFVHSFLADGKALDENLAEICEIFVYHAHSHDGACQGIDRTRVVANRSLVETANAVPCPESAFIQVNRSRIAKTTIRFAKLNFECAAIVCFIDFSLVHIEADVIRHFPAAVPMIGIAANKKEFCDSFCINFRHTDLLFEHGTHNPSPFSSFSNSRAWSRTSFVTGLPPSFMARKISKTSARVTLWSISATPMEASINQFLSCAERSL